jgi:hypothetical protein
MVGSNINDIRWCVPSALHIITDKPYEECLQLIKNHLGDDPISGVYIPIAVKILEVELGYTVKRVKAGMRLSQYMDKKYYYKTFLIAIPGHALVIRHSLLFDNKNLNGILTPYKAPVVEAFLVER